MLVNYLTIREICSPSNSTDLFWISSEASMLARVTLIGIFADLIIFIRFRTRYITITEPSHFFNCCETVGSIYIYNPLEIFCILQYTQNIIRISHCSNQFYAH